MADIILSSVNSRRVKYIKRLKQKKFRDQEGKFLVEGLRLVKEALESDWETEALLYTAPFKAAEGSKSLFEIAKKRKARLWEVGESLMKAITDTQTPQGIAALVRMKDFAIEDVLPENDKANHPLLLLVDGVQDPGNLGAMIRNADAAAVSGVVLFSGTVDPYNSKTLRASMGSLFHIPVINSTADIFLDQTKKCGLQILVADPRGQKPIWDIDFTLPTALVLANEAHGAGEEIRALADYFVAIPMPGRSESLNVATATAILLYEAVKQRSQVAAKNYL